LFSETGQSENRTGRAPNWASTELKLKLGKHRTGRQSVLCFLKLDNLFSETVQEPNWATTLQTGQQYELGDNLFSVQHRMQHYKLKLGDNTVKLRVLQAKTGRQYTESLTTLQAEIQ
jgi:hypothetical protein